MSFSFLAIRLVGAALALATLAACSKSDSATPAPVDGMSWNVDGSTTTANSYQPNVSGNSIILTGSAISSTVFSSVTLTLPLKAGTYDLATSPAVNAVYVAGTGTTSGTAYYATTGAATVTSVTATTLAGTFSFRGTDANGTASKTISSGKFNVKLP